MFFSSFTAEIYNNHFEVRCTHADENGSLLAPNQYQFPGSNINSLENIPMVTCINLSDTHTRARAHTHTHTHTHSLNLDQGEMSFIS